MPVNLDYVQSFTSNQFNRAQETNRNTMKQVSTGNRLEGSNDLYGSLVNRNYNLNSKLANVATTATQTVLNILNQRQSGLATLQGLLSDMQSLASQIVSAGNNAAISDPLEAQFNTLQSQYSDIVSNTTFNGANLFNGQFGGTGSISLANTKVTNTSTIASTAAAFLKGTGKTSVYPTATITAAATSNANAADGVDKLTVGSTVFTFKNNPSAETDVQIGSTQADSMRNLLLKLENSTADDVKKYSYNLDLSTAGTTKLVVTSLAANSAKIDTEIVPSNTAGKMFDTADTAPGYSAAATTPVDFSTYTSANTPIGQFGSVTLGRVGAGLIAGGTVDGTDIIDTVFQQYGQTIPAGTKYDANGNVVDFMEIKFNIGDTQYVGFGSTSYALDGTAAPGTKFVSANVTKITSFTCKKVGDGNTGPFFTINLDTGLSINATANNTVVTGVNNMSADGVNLSKMQSSLSTDFATTVAYQSNYLALNTTGGDIVNAGNTVGSVSGMTAFLQTSTGFSSTDLAVSNVSVSAVAGAVNTYQISVTMGGVAYSNANFNPSTPYVEAGDQIVLSDSTGNNKITIMNGNKRLDLSSADNLSAIETAWSQAFSATSNAKFIIGASGDATNSADVYTLSLAPVSWLDAFKDEQGNIVAVDFTDITASQKTLEGVQVAVQYLSKQQAYAGAFATAMNANMDNLTAITENYSAATEAISSVNSAEAASLIANVSKLYLQLIAAVQAYQRTQETANQALRS